MALHYKLCYVILIFETALCILLCLPMPWFLQNIISKLVHKLASFHRVTQPLAAGLVLLFAGAVQSILKLNNDVPTTDHGLHMHNEHLFYAQRNLYLTGFSALLLFVVNRLAVLLSKSHQAEVSAIALQKQAKNASDQASKLMDQNKGEGSKSSAAEAVLKEQLEEMKKKVSALEDEKTTLTTKVTTLEEENKGLSKEIAKLNAAVASKKDD
eukprot:Rmarinus@m.9126